MYSSVTFSSNFEQQQRTMQKSSQWICLIAFSVLVVTTCMARTGVNQAKMIDDYPDHLHRKLQFDDCVTFTMKDEACHADICHKTTTYIHTCDYYNSSNCDYYSGRIDICNSTNCQNTTRHIDACYNDVSDDCGDADVTCHSCTNDVCRNRTTHFHACFTESLTQTASAFCDGCYIGIYAFDCIESLKKSFLRHIGSGK